MDARAEVAAGVQPSESIQRSSRRLPRRERRRRAAARAHEGFQSGFVACIVLAGIGLLAVLVLLGRAAQAPRIERLEAIPEPAGD